jgi:hypothetical protein
VEYKKINEILGKADNMALHKLILALIPRIAFFFYWIFDSLIVLAKIKFLNNVDAKWITHKWALCWTVANFTGIIGHIVELVEIGKDEAKLIAQKRVASQGAGSQIDSVNGQQKTSVDEIKQKQRDLAKKKFAQCLGIIAKTGDSITSTNILGWDANYLGYKFNNGWIGLGGFTSACISSYNLYPAAKK